MEENGFLDIFGQLTDSRIDRKKLHPMPEILLLTLCAVIFGAESWDDIELFGESKLDFLRTFLPFENGKKRECQSTSKSFQKNGEINIEFFPL